MGIMQRRKGQSGEREIAALIAELTGLEVKRKVRQHKNDTDIEGVKGWAVEVKRAAKPTVTTWWEQAVRQAEHISKDGGTHIPVLFYRVDRKPWRAVLPLRAVHTDYENFDDSLPYAVECSVECWAAIAVEMAARTGNLTWRESTDR